MEKLIFDSGIKEYELGAGILRFNPSDPNVYARFSEALPVVTAIEDEMIRKGMELTDTTSRLNLMREADTKVKAKLGEIFPGNDFDAMLEGVNLLAVAGNGERVITNLLAALTPIVKEGVKTFADTAVAKAKAARDQRHADQLGLV